MNRVLVLGNLAEGYTFFLMVLLQPLLHIMLYQPLRFERWPKVKKEELLVYLPPFSFAVDNEDGLYLTKSNWWSCVFSPQIHLVTKCVFPKRSWSASVYSLNPSDRRECVFPHSAAHMCVHLLGWQNQELKKEKTVNMIQTKMYSGSFPVFIKIWSVV